MTGLNDLVISWRDFGIIESIVLGYDHFSHNIEKNIIYLPQNSEFFDENYKVKVYGDGRIEFKGKKIELKRGKVAVIDSSLEIYDEETFVEKYL